MWKGELFWNISNSNACNDGDLGLIPGLGRSPKDGKGYPLQYSGLEDSRDCIVQSMGLQRFRHDWVAFTFSLFNSKVLFSIKKKKLLPNIYSYWMNSVASTACKMKIKWNLEYNSQLFSNLASGTVRWYNKIIMGFGDKRSGIQCLLQKTWSNI